MSTPIPTWNVMRRSLVLTAVLGASAAMMGAQVSSSSLDSADSTGAATATTHSEPTLNLQTPGLDAARPAMFSSSSADNEVAVNTDHFNFVDAMQYGGGGRRYGRPRYRGSNTNADGSSKYDFFAGAGFTQPVGNTYHYLTPSYSFQVGGGRQFNKNLALNLQFDWDNFGFNGRTIGNQIYIYDTLFGQGAVDGLLDGHSHIWSFSLDPTYTIYSGPGLGAYIVGGVGFYHKVANFTIPQLVEGYDEFGYPVEYEANEPIDSYVSNAPGFNGGLGLTYKFSRFSNERLYGEIRYVVTLNSQRAGYTVNTVQNANATATNFYPANSNRTTYLPVKFGIRF